MPASDPRSAALFTTPRSQHPSAIGRPRSTEGTDYLFRPTHHGKRSALAAKKAVCPPTLSQHHVRSTHVRCPPAIHEVPPFHNPTCAAPMRDARQRSTKCNPFTKRRSQHPSALVAPDPPRGLTTFFAPHITGKRISSAAKKAVCPPILPQHHVRSTHPPPIALF